MSKKDVTKTVHSVIVLQSLYLTSLEEYCDHGNNFFEKRLREHEKTLTGSPNDPGLLYVFRFKHDVEYNSYFGLLMAFASFEKFLGTLYDITVDLGTMPRLRQAMFTLVESWLPLDGYKRFFKTLDCDITVPTKEWNQLKKLQVFRNAIVHQQGIVTHANERFLSPYGYEIGKSLNVTFTDVKENI